MQDRNLSEIIIDKIRCEGPISFREYMELCLYHPELGYYTSSAGRIGKEGDFLTTSSMDSLFGALIGRQIEEVWEILDKRPFTIVEYGAGTGRLCKDILEYLENKTALYESLDYYIIEKSLAMRQQQKALLNEKVKWIISIDEIPPVTGFILSNEVVDNFSVHRVKMESELMEVFVDYQEGFKEVLLPAGDKLHNYLAELGVHLPEGYETEINLEATDWIGNIGVHLKQGYVMTIDYGYSSAQLYKDSRKNGTLMCYYKHDLNDRPYENIGEQDITAHVNFSALSHWGAKNGLDTCGFISQAGFLMAMGWEDYLQKLLMKGNDGYMNFRQYASLKHTILVNMGPKFNVLVQSKAVPSVALRGIHSEMQIEI